MIKITIITLISTIVFGCEPIKESLDVLEYGTDQLLGMDTVHLNNIDSVLHKYVELNKLPGAVVLVARNNQVIKHLAVGEKNEHEVQQKDDIFRIASMTKAITAVAAMTLLEEGKFSLDDPVWWFIPEFRQPEILELVNPEDSSFTSRPSETEITIRQLFNHTSGIGYGFQDDKLNAVYVKHGISEGFEEKDISLEENIKTLAKLPLVHEPGETWTYGLSYDVLGYLIEVISGKPFDQYLQEQIFEPLDMNDTHFYLPEDKYDRLSAVYMSSHEGVVPTNYQLINYPTQGAKRYLSGGADLSTTAFDYAKFAQMLMNNGMYNGNRILGSRTVEWMTTGQIQSGLKAIGWGFGVVIESDEMMSYVSPGSCYWGGFFGTQCLMDPSEGIIVILMIQMYPNWEWNIPAKLHNIVYASLR